MNIKTGLKVIDASALAAILFSEAEADQTVEQIGSAELVAPRLLPLEIASVCLKKMRRNPEKRKDIFAAYELFDQMRITQIDVPLRKAILLAENKKLTIYDALYVWLSESLNAELITLDREVLKAIQSEFPSSWK